MEKQKISRICVVIPTLNEESTIYNVVKGFLKLANSFPLVVLVVDGHSSDETVRLAKEAGASVIIQKGRGKGVALIEAVNAVESDIYVFIDGDGTYLPSEFRLIISPILDDKADMVIGSRFEGKIEKGSIPPINVLGNKLFNFIIRIAFKVVITDVLSGYRAVKREFFKKLGLKSHHFEIEAEMTLKAIAKGFRVLEVPITYLRRRGKPTKLRPFRDGLRIFKTILVEILRGRFLGS